MWMLHLGRRLRDAGLIAVVVLLASPPAPGGVVFAAPAVTMCDEVDDLVGPWPLDAMGMPALGDEQHAQAPLVCTWAIEPAPPTTVEVGLGLAMAFAARSFVLVHDVAATAWAFVTRPWTDAPAPATLIDDPWDLPEASGLPPLPSGLSDPGSDDADAWIEPGLGPLGCVPVAMTTDLEVTTPVLASLVVDRPAAGPERSGPLDPADILLRMAAITFMATVALVPVVCSLAAPHVPA